MKNIGIVALVTAIGLAVVASAVYAGRDRSILNPPPDAVTEALVRQLAMGRYELARRYFATGVKQQTLVEELRRGFEPLRQYTGKPDQVVTEIAIMTGDEARVLATLEGRQGTASMYVDLRIENREWKAVRWPLDVVGKAKP
jgi:hypothetical protein